MINGLVVKFVAESALRWSVPFLIVFIGLLADRGRTKRLFPAGTRNFLCRTLLVLLFALPIGHVFTVPVPVPPLLYRISISRHVEIMAAAKVRFNRGADNDLPIRMAGYVYLAIAISLSLRLLLGLAGLRSIAVSSEPFGGRVFSPGANFDLRLTRMLRTPAAYCFRRPPLILVPKNWTAWSDETQSAVVIHELSHLRRNDGWWQVFSTLAVALFWFHPAVWWLHRELLISAEECCDRDVIAAGVLPDRYAGLLLWLAGGELPPEQVLSISSGKALKRRLFTMQQCPEVRQKVTLLAEFRNGGRSSNGRNNIGSAAA